MLQKENVTLMSVAFVYFAAIHLRAFAAKAHGLLFRLILVLTFHHLEVGLDGLPLGFMLFFHNAHRSLSSNAATSSAFSMAICR